MHIRNCLKSYGHFQTIYGIYRQSEYSRNIAISFSCKMRQKVNYRIVFETSKSLYIIGGTAWESNPANLARRSQTVLKTAEDTSTPIGPMRQIILY